jgi:hypothetical protein
MEGNCIMNAAQTEAIIRYVDAKIEYELASIEEDGDGYRGACVTERKAMEAAKEDLLSL